MYRIQAVYRSGGFSLKRALEAAAISCKSSRADRSMAKSGEGDKRWIVTDRKDGTNVHNWHWAEKDVTSWAAGRLAELLNGLVLSSGTKDVELATLNATTVTGEVVINNRKNKLIPAYELEIKGTWSGTVQPLSGEPAKVDGQWRVPYLAEENADEDPEFVVSLRVEDAAHARAKTTIMADGRQAVFARLRQFVKEVTAGGPLASNSGAALPSDRQAGAAAPSTGPLPKQVLPTQRQPSGTKRLRTFRTSEKFYARAADIYECFTDSQRIHAYTQSPAKVSPKEGGEFEIFGGSVLGRFRLVAPNERILLDWRFRNWQEKDTSKVDLCFEEPEVGTTVVTLEHSGIPEEDQFGNADCYDTTANGWKQQIFHKIRAVFGYGLGL